MLLFFHVEDNGTLVEYAYSFLRSIFNTAQLRFYHVLPTLISPVKEVYYGHIHAWTKLHTEVELLWFRK